MRVQNIHSRLIAASAQAVGGLLDTLSSSADVLWPHATWPAMTFDRPLQVGAVGGHGPIRYFVQTYCPGQAIEFRFLSPQGFVGTHGFLVVPQGEHCVLTHTVAMNTVGAAVLSWPIVFGPLHDALMEDALSKAEQATTGSSQQRQWSPWVKLLRELLRPRVRPA